MRCAHEETSLRYQGLLIQWKFGAQVRGNLSSADEQVTAQDMTHTRTNRDDLGHTTPTARAIEDEYPLSPMQQGMLFNTLLEPDSGVDIEQVDCTLHEALDVATFKRAWQRVVARHGVLRTSLRWKDVSEPRQEVDAQVELPWEEQNWSEIEESERDGRLADFLGADRRRGFDLTQAPLFRLTMLRYGEAEVHVIWTIYHGVLDGRSLVLVLREVFAFYEASCLGKEISIPLPTPYRHYVDWLRGQDAHRSEAFWRETLKGFIVPTPLVVDRAPGTQEVGRARKGYQEISLSAQATSALRTLAQDNEFTLNTIVQGAWAFLLSRYSGETDIVFGVIRAARRSTIEGASAMIGLFINTLPLRVLVDDEQPIILWLNGIRQQWTAMREHEHAALASVQAASEISASTPLFQSTVMFENDDLDATLRDGNGAWSQRHFRQFSQTNYPVDLAAYGGRELRLRIDYDRFRIDAEAAARMIGEIRALLEAIAVDPQRRLGALPLLTPAERHQLLIEWNSTAVGYGSKQCIHELFEAQAERSPETIAVKFENQHITYRELNRQSNQLARHLRDLGVAPDVLVAICSERSLEMVVSLLGVLKAGGAYVPIDPTYPAERVAFILNDAGARVLLVQEHLIAKLPALEGTRIVSLNEPEWTISPETGNNLPRTATPANLAYLIYTSGSTGQPKGVMIPHRAIVNHLRWMQSKFPMNEGDCVLQKTEFSFDVSVWELFAPLAVGARMVVARPGGHQDPGYLVDTIIQHQVTVLQLVPLLLRMLVENHEFKNCSRLRHIFCGGETMPEDLPRRVYAVLGAELHNMYGPTEAAIDSLHYTVPRYHSGGVIPIGRPVANTQAYVLDHRGEPVPVGVPGELYLGGVQVGRGYHNRPELTAQCFIADHFRNVPGAKLYKTGDRVRFLADGNIEFLGRIDDQVKIRGFRIELGEIARTLQMHAAVRECVVVVREDVPGDRQLVAYVIPASSSTAELREALRDFLKKRLPAYMIPSAFVLLEVFPLTPNGKVNRKRLPVPVRKSLEPDKSYVAPRTATEQSLVAIWRDVLDLDEVSVRANFFELGGDSLSLVQLLVEINSAHRVDLGVPELIQNPTVEAVARLLDESRPTSRSLSQVVCLRDGSGGLPVYFINPGRAELRIAQRMSDKHSAFGIDVRWPLKWRNALASKQRSGYPTMEELIAPYVNALDGHIGSSPCVLVGLSVSGLMAFEVAHQLQKRGGKVDLVIVVDTTAVPLNPYLAAWHIWRQDWQRVETGLAREQSLRRIVSTLQRSLRTTRWLIGRARDKVIRRFFSPAILSSLCDERGMPLPWVLVEALFEELDKTYRPRRLDSQGVLFRTEAPSLYAYDDDSLGWKGLFARGLEIRSMVGDHLGVYREQLPALAAEISDVIERWSRDRKRLDTLDTFYLMVLALLGGV
jgi:amino acid adenylation domain-containing protein